MGLLGVAQVWGRGKKVSLLKIYHTYHTMIKLGKVILYLSKIQDHQKWSIILISRNIDIDCILIYNFKFFKRFWVFKGCFNKHGWNFDDVSKTGNAKPS